MQEQQCAEQARLSIAMRIAVQAVFVAKAEYNMAAKELRDTARYAALLADVRAAEDRAVKALDQHRKEHGC